MDALNSFLALISKTEGRDKFLRLIQYATLHSVTQINKKSAFNVYQQMRMTRKLLRFLRSLQYSSKIRQQFPELKNSLGAWPQFIKHLVSMLENLFTVLFFLSDHRVCLGQLGVISRQTAVAHYPRSMKFYFLQNFMGILRNVISMATVIEQSKKERQSKMVVKAIKKFSFDLIRCLFDCIIATYYLYNNLPAAKVGILGVLSSVMAIMQILQKMP